MQDLLSLDLQMKENHLPKFEIIALVVPMAPFCFL